MQIERVNIPNRLAAERELLLPQVVALLQDAARNARARELKLVFVKALARIWRARPDLKPKVQAEENPLPTPRAISRMATICSALCFFRAMPQLLSYQIFSHFPWYKIRRSRQCPNSGLRNFGFLGDGTSVVVRP